MAMKRGSSKPKLLLRYVGSPNAKGSDETRKVCQYKAKGGYFPDGACCKNCRNFPEEIRVNDNKQRGQCQLLNFGVSKTGLCTKYVHFSKPKVKVTGPGFHG